MKKVDLSKVKEAGSGSYKRLPVGGYVLRILKVVDVPEYNRLDFYYDIAEGEYKDYYNERYKANTNENKKWGGRFSKSYDANNERALPFFKQFVTAVQNSNKGFVWDEEHEQQFVKKLVGATFREEEFVGQNGKVAVSCKPDMFHSVDKIRSGDFTIREIKRLTTTKATTAPANDPIPDFSDVFNTASTDTPTPAESENPWDDSDENPFNL